MKQDFLLIWRNITIQVVGSGVKWRERGGEWCSVGEYQHTVDDKGRMIVPAKFREALGASFIVTRGLDQCLFVYPMQEWSVLEQKLKALPLMKSDARAFTRFFSPAPPNASWTSKAG